MFTGIVEELGTIQKISTEALTISCQKILDDLKIGDSIAVNGVCLTVTSFEKNFFVADVMPETFRKTNFNQLKIGSPVNLERALTLQSRLGGHIVSGHIDGIGKIQSIYSENQAKIFKITCEKNLLHYIVKKGSICIDGISLTVVDVNLPQKFFTVSLIPHTQTITILHTKKIGDTCNLETDILAKYIERFFQAAAQESSASLITKKFLQDNGF